MTDSKPGFWQTLPGVLTALAGLITAVAGLIVAFNQMQGRSARASETEQPPAVASSSPAVRPGETVPAIAAALTVGAPGEVRFKNGTLVFSVLEARLEPFNQDMRLLTVRLRINNGMKEFDRSYYAELRAIADGLPQAPVDPPLEQIEAHSVKDLTYTFRLPAAVRRLALRITRDEQVGDIPLQLK